MRSYIKKFFNRPIKFESSYPMGDISNLDKIISKNRQSLNMVSDWLPAAVKEKSYYNYGVPPQISDLINLPIGQGVTYTDLIIHYSRLLSKVNYLELGVSIGKNFHQISNAWIRQKMTGYDIENINPVIEQTLTHMSDQTWVTMPESIRKEDSSLKFYEDKNGNEIKYLAGDIWDANSWAKLSGQKFNIIFSDALHDPKALLWEFEMINKYKLLDEQFIFCWDDLNNGLEESFFSIAKQLKQIRGKDVKSYFFKVNGWLGQNYPEQHDFGIVTNLKLH